MLDIHYLRQHINHFSLTNLLWTLLSQHVVDFANISLLKKKKNSTKSLSTLFKRFQYFMTFLHTSIMIGNSPASANTANLLLFLFTRKMFLIHCKWWLSKTLLKNIFEFHFSIFTNISKFAIQKHPVYTSEPYIKGQV